MSINDVVNKKNGAAKKAKISAADFVFYRVMALFALLVVYIIFELVAHNSGTDVLVMVNVANICTVLLAVAAAVFFVLSLTVKKNGVFGSGKVLSAGFIAGALAGLAVFVGFTFHISESSALVILAFAAVALVFIGYTFSRDFFLLSLVTVALTVLSLWPKLFVYSNGIYRDLANYLSVAVAFVICAAFCVLVLVACYGKSAKLSRWFFNLGYVRLYPLYLLPAAGFAVSLIRLFAPAILSYALVITVVMYMIFLVMYAFDSAK
ncbi:MAG: hypothetical protein IJF74_07915 [Clostridia bacterium]|nr:hypothetical protein [Clostridia bacterium]